MAVFSPNIFTQRASVSVWRLPHQQHPLCSLKESWNEKKLAKMSHLHIFHYHYSSNGAAQQPRHLSPWSFVRRLWLEIFLGPTKQNLSNGWPKISGLSSRMPILKYPVWSWRLLRVYNARYLADKESSRPHLLSSSICWWGAICFLEVTMPDAPWQWQHRAPIVVASSCVLGGLPGLWRRGRSGAYVGGGWGRWDREKRGLLGDAPLSRD